jgi:ketosteroid isomerase-like protein
MHRLIAIAAFVAAAFTVSAHAASAAPSAVLAPIATLVRTSNTGDRAAFLKLFTPDAAVVDNFAPYRFAPPNGPAKWYDGFGADAAASGSTDGVISTRTPKYVHVTGDHAWIVMPTEYRYKLKGKPELETGSLVFTESRLHGTWLITSMSWAEFSDSGFPQS